MKITIVGTGYVGLVTGACFADMGNDVICLDVDEKKINSLNNGIVPIYEPGLKELVEKDMKENRLKFTLEKSEAYKSSDIIFICVGTPPKSDGDADLNYVLSVARDIGKYNKKNYVVVVDKSTVPVGTAQKVTRVIQDSSNGRFKFDVVSNPEFLREGAAIRDFQNPDRIVVGSDSDRPKDIMKKLYESVARVGKPIMFTDTKSAELIKYASNAMLATKISFMNELSHLCEAVGADIKEVAKGMGLDSRIGPRFLQAGVGYGGSCFPKDVKALSQSMEKRGLTSNILMAVDYVNERQKKSLVPKLKRLFPSLDGKTITLWGLSFKPKTDDIREAPSIIIINQLLDEYSNVNVYDPEAMENMKRIFPNINYFDNMYDALKGSDVLLIVTEWDVFRFPDFERMKSLMNEPIIIDGRNIYNPDDMLNNGFKYVGVGR